MPLSNHQIKWKHYYYSIVIKSVESGLWSEKDLVSNSCCISCMLFNLEEFTFLSEFWVPYMQDSYR